MSYLCKYRLCAANNGKGLPELRQRSVTVLRMPYSVACSRFARSLAGTTLPANVAKISFICWLDGVRQASPCATHADCLQVTRADRGVLLPSPDSLLLVSQAVSKPSTVKVEEHWFECHFVYGVPSNFQRKKLSFRDYCKAYQKQSV